MCSFSACILASSIVNHESIPVSDANFGFIELNAQDIVITCRVYGLTSVVKMLLAVATVWRCGRQPALFRERIPVLRAFLTRIKELSWLS